MSERCEHTRPLTIYTSLPPFIKRPFGGTEFGGVYQRACIESWCRAGFRVVSINPIEEVESLRKLDYPVEFAISAGGRPAMSDLLQVIQTSEAPVAGIINADCLLVYLPHALNEICHHAQDGMVILERLNIDPETMRPTGESCWGFDAFFFETVTLRELVCNEELRIGEYWWDYWLPLAYAAEGAKLFSSSAPILLHIDHAQVGLWNRCWVQNGNRMLRELLTRSLPPELEMLVSECRGECLSEEELLPFSERCFLWLQSRPAPTLVRDGEWEDFVLRLLRGLSDSPEKALRREISRLTARCS